MATKKANYKKQSAYFLFKNEIKINHSVAPLINVYSLSFSIVIKHRYSIHDALQRVLVRIIMHLISVVSLYVTTVTDKMKTTRVSHTSRRCLIT